MLRYFVDANKLESYVKLLNSKHLCLYNADIAGSMAYIWCFTRGNSVKALDVQVFMYQKKSYPSKHQRIGKATFVSKHHVPTKQYINEDTEFEYRFT